MKENWPKMSRADSPRLAIYPGPKNWQDNISTMNWFDGFNCDLEASELDDLGFYIHLPFCEELCAFCGCNTTITHDHSVESEYIDAVLSELDRCLERVRELEHRKVSYLYLGGGTPNFFSSGHLEKLLRGIEKRISLSEDLEGFSEWDPRYSTRDKIKTLVGYGLRNFTIGVQDFDPPVQKKINRRQSLFQVRQTVSDIRKLSKSKPKATVEKREKVGAEAVVATDAIIPADSTVTFEFVIGLPGQKNGGYKQNLSAIEELDPDRVMVYRWVQVPWVKEEQIPFSNSDIPSEEVVSSEMTSFEKGLLELGYEPVGLDCFAKKEDLWTLKKRSRALERGFSSFHSKPIAALLGLGVGAISESANWIHQNQKALPVYLREVQNSSSEENKRHGQRGLCRSEFQAKLARIIRELQSKGRTSLKEIINSEAMNLLKQQLLGKEFLVEIQNFEILLADDSMGSQRRIIAAIVEEIMAFEGERR